MSDLSHEAPTAGSDRLRPAGRAWIAPAGWLGLGLLTVGVLHAATHVLALLSGERATAGEVVTSGILILNDLLLSGMAAWAAAWLLRAAARRDQAIAVQSAEARRAVALIEGQVLPALARLAEALERRPEATAASRVDAVAEVRRAMDEGRWVEAEALALALASDRPDDPRARALGDEVARRRQGVVADLRARLDAARGAHDAERVVALHGELAGHLDPDPRRDLDREVVPWLMALVRRGLTQVPVRLDVVQLAALVAERFAGTQEGASLSRSLPVLRRAVGLCPRCARPYTGVEAACPECLGTPGPEDVVPIEAQPRPSLLEEAGIADDEPEPPAAGAETHSG